MDGPPSYTSVAARKSDQQQPQVTEPNQFEEDQNNPSMSKIRSMEDQPQSDRSFEAGTGARGIVQPTETHDGEHVQAVSIGAIGFRGTDILLQDQRSDNSDNHEPALSVGDMVGDRGNSQPVGGRFMSYGSTAPPSLSDVARRDEYHTGETGGVQNLLEGDYEGMSITGRDFGRVYPKMSQMEDDHNPSL